MSIEPPARRVLIADDQQLVRAGFRLILDHNPGIDVVGEAADGVEALAQARRLNPDVVLMDIRMPRMDGIEATRQIIRLPSGPRVLVLTTFDVDEYVYRSLRAGAIGFLLKDAPEAQLIAAIHAAAAGIPAIAPAVVARMADAFGPKVGPRGTGWPLDRLTSRETDVLREIAAGQSNAQIAHRLYLSESTVKTHVARVLAKLDLVSRTQAVVVAYESGLVAPSNEPKP